MFRQTIVIINIGLLLLTCNNSHTQIENKKEVEIISELPDSLFAIKDLKNTLILNHIEYDHFTATLLNNNKKTQLIKLDSLQVLKLIGALPKFNPNLNPDNRELIMNDWSIWFLAKQKPVGSNYPIIVFISGTDYGGLFLIVLDKTKTPISFLELNGEEHDGSVYSPNVHSYLNENEITTCKQTIVKIVSDSNSDTAIIDSVTYLSKILPIGRITTTKKDSFRVNKKISRL